ncbi:MAG: ATP synthase F1 subunit gamma [Thermodesulfobacteriota bacterium]
MANLSDIKRRIKSVKNTQQITKAMKMVSAAKLRRAQENIIAARPYADKMQEMITSLSTKVPPESHPLFSSTESGKVELILITSDRGLCGGFNSGLIRKALRFIEENSDKKISLSLLGRRAVDHFKKSEIPKTKATELGNKRPSYDFAAGIASEIISAYTAEEEGTEEVHIIYSAFQSALVQTPVVQKILPMIPPETEAEEVTELLFEPSPEGVLDSLLPRYVEVQIFRALLESSASEHGARMTAMESATSNASTMIDSLTLIYNRARQAAITGELMEIISGSEALK